MTAQSRRVLLVGMWLFGLIIVVASMTLASLITRPFEMWALRMFSFILFIGSLWLGYAIYQYFALTEELAADVEIAKANAEIEQTRLLSTQKTKDRIIPVNTQVPRVPVFNDDQIQLTDSLSLTKEKLTEFITRSTQSDIGLKISLWKKEGWDQIVVEKLLDYLCVLGIVTPRENGRACEYVKPNIAPHEVLREISRATV